MAKRAREQALRERRERKKAKKEETAEERAASREARAGGVFGTEDSVSTAGAEPTERQQA